MVKPKRPPRAAQPETERLARVIENAAREILVDAGPALLHVFCAQLARAITEGRGARQRSKSPRSAKTARKGQKG